MSLLGGEDTMCVLATGGGKSAVFQLPALCHGWRMLVFSPLRALMRDQVLALQEKGIEAGMMSSDQSETQNLMTAQDWMHDHLKILYVAPERIPNEHFRQAMTERPPEMVVLDEAHCVSDWSDNFRSDYCRIGDLIDQFNPRVVAAFTATYTGDIGKDVKRVLRIPQARMVCHYRQRQELELHSGEYDGPAALYREVREVCQGRGPVLVYCGTTADVESVAASMSRAGERDDLAVGAYHGKMSGSARSHVQDSFMGDELDIMVATCAFGMGVDKGNIRGIFHVDYPHSPEQLAQETGRAGRDGGKSHCMAYTRDRADSWAEFALDMSNPPERTIRAIYEALDRAANAEAIFHMSQNDIAQSAGVEQNHVEAVMQTLRGSNVIREVKNMPRVHQVRFLGESDGKKFGEYREAIEEQGDFTDGSYEFDLNGLSQALGVGEQTARKYFTAWAKEGVIAWTQPPRSRPYRVIGSLADVNLERLRLKRQIDYDKLAQVRFYLELPDDEKHDFLEDYFVKTWGLA